MHSLIILVVQSGIFLTGLVTLIWHLINSSKKEKRTLLKKSIYNHLKNSEELNESQLSTIFEDGKYNRKEIKEALFDMQSEGTIIRTQQNTIKPKIHFENSLLEKLFSITELGVLGIYETAESTIESELESVQRTYEWLGVSAYWVLANPERVNEYIIGRAATVRFTFLIINPECDWAISQQGSWQKNTSRNTLINISLKQRVKASLMELKRLKDCGLPIEWFLLDCPQPFRITIVDEAKVL